MLFAKVVLSLMLRRCARLYLDTQRSAHLRRARECVSAASGEILAIMGPSGSGKVTKTVTTATTPRSSQPASTVTYLQRQVGRLQPASGRRRSTSTRARAWTAQELADFLEAARSQRPYPALHLTAFTGMRRGEVVLKWSDFDPTTKGVSISRTHLLIQVRTRALNEELADDFHSWYPGFTHTAEHPDIAA